MVAGRLVGRGHRRDQTMATLLTTIVLVFIACHSLKTGLNIYEAYMVYRVRPLKFSPGHFLDYTIRIHIIYLEESG